MTTAKDSVNVQIRNQGLLICKNGCLEGTKNEKTAVHTLSELGEVDVVFEKECERSKGESEVHTSLA